MENSTLKIYCDGGARGNPGPAAAAFVVEENGKVIHKAAKYLGEATNNVAEYRAVLLALDWLLKNPDVRHATSNIHLVLDSELVANQLLGNYKVKKENLRNYFFSIKELEKKINVHILYSHVRRHNNKLADFLVNKTLDNSL